MGLIKTIYCMKKKGDQIVTLWTVLHCVTMDSLHWTVENLVTYSFSLLLHHAGKQYKTNKQTNSSKLSAMADNIYVMNHLTTVYYKSQQGDDATVSL